MSEPQWEKQQRETFLRWINNKLKDVPGSKKVDSLKDLSDGVALCQMFESMFPQAKMPKYNKNPKLPAHKLDNLQIVFNHLEKTGVRTFCKPQNVYETNQTMVLGLLWTMILEFDINRAMKAAAAQSEVAKGQHQFDYKPGKPKDNLLAWTRAHTQPYDVDPQNFDTDFSDGNALLALVHSMRPDLFKWDDMDRSNPRANVVQAMNMADKEMGIPPLLDADSLVAGHADEKAVMAYVAQFLDYETNNAQKVQTLRHEYGEQARKEEEAREALVAQQRANLAREQKELDDEKRRAEEKKMAEQRAAEEALARQRAQIEEQRRQIEEMRQAEERKHQEEMQRQEEELRKQQEEIEEQRRQMEEMQRKTAELEKAKAAKQKAQLEEQRREMEEQKRKVAELEEQKRIAEQKQMEQEQRALEEQKKQLKLVEEQKKQLMALEKKKREIAKQKQQLKDAEKARRDVLMKQQELLKKKAELERERAALNQKNVVQLNMAKEVSRMSFFQSLAERQTRDYVLFVDKSGSMAGNRWVEARKAVESLAPQVTRACPLGISLYFFNDECTRIDNITTSEQVAGFFQNEKPDRGTNLHLAVKHAFNIHFAAKKGLQPETWLIITDGAPDKPTHVYQLLKEMGKKFKTPDEVTVSFIQIGNDDKATEYLRKLRGSLPFIDTLTQEDLPKREEFSTLFTQK